jgi:putative oxidoreductase
MKPDRTERQAWALFIVRLLLGSTFILHGSQKVLGLFGGSGLSGFAGFVSRLGMPAVLGYIAPFCEFIGGWLVLLGVVTEVGALLIVPVMLVAISAVHLSHGYFLDKQGFEYPLNMLLAAFALIVGGPGKLALWDPFKKHATVRTQAAEVG